ncbi:MAG: signal peptidase I [Acutalibacteraceae bacterium]
MGKALNVIKNIFVWLMVILAVCMMIFTIVSVNTFDRSDRSLFGYKAFIVLSDSMSKTDFSAGDLVLTKEVDPSTLKEGDIIAYSSQNAENYGETVTHKIRKLTTDANGEAGFITYGTTTDTDDELVVTYPYVLGKYKTHIPKIGSFFMFLKTTPGYIVCILIPFLLLILIQGLNCIRLFRRYKQEQMDEMKEEREKLEAERAESQKMMAELLELKSQLASQQAVKSAANTDTASDISESNGE